MNSTTLSNNSDVFKKIYKIYLDMHKITENSPKFLQHTYQCFLTQREHSHFKSSFPRIFHPKSMQRNIFSEKTENSKIIFLEDQPAWPLGWVLHSLVLDNLVSTQTKVLGV